jgi:sulfur-carrier protein
MSFRLLLRFKQHKGKVMANKIRLPRPLQPYADGQALVEAKGATIGDVLADLTARHPGLRRHIFIEEGRLRSFVNVYLNDVDIQYLLELQTPVSLGDEISVVEPVGGCI